MNTFEATLTVLTRRGFSNALELANEVELELWRPKKLQLNKIESEATHILNVVNLNFGECYTHDKYSMRHAKRITLTLPITMQAIKGRSRKREIVQARQLVMYFLRKLGYSLNTCSALVGGRHHSTCIHSIQVVQDMNDTNRDYRAKFDEVERELL